jgi:hypothetical protein
MHDRPLPRPFGAEAGDLDLDFTADAGPVLVTRILCSCLRDAQGHAPAEAAVWNWTLHRRLQALIAVERAGGGNAGSVRLNCPHAGCAQPMELDLDLEHFRLPDQPLQFDLDIASDVRLSVRLPSGADQRRWCHEASRGGALEPRLARELVQAVNDEPLTEGEPLPRHWFEQLATALEERDPLTALHLRARCPACGEAVAVEFDLERHLLQSAAGRQARLLDTVHRLAGAYHWSEREILALPRHRREQYLSRVQNGASQ